MKIALIGAGTVGVASAHELALDGHAVHVFDRHSAPAAEASFAAAGLGNCGLMQPWPEPSQGLKDLLPRTAADLRWLWRHRRACKAASYAANRQRLQQLARFNDQRLAQLQADCKFELDRTEGLCLLLRSERELARADADYKRLREEGIACQLLDASATRALEPALSLDTIIHGALHLPGAPVSNSRQFTQLQKAEAQRLGVKFSFNAEVHALDPAQPTLLRWSQQGTGHSERYDAVLVCAGLAGAALLRPLGLRLPLAAIHGYSISAQIREPLNAPRAAVLDAQRKVLISRLGQRVRISGGCELGGGVGQLRDASIQPLFKALHDWFPGAAQLSSGVQQWKGARPTLPDGLPVLGAAGAAGVWLNLGHGAHGWALASGCARAVANLMQGRDPGVDLDGLGVSRLG